MKNIDKSVILSTAYKEWEENLEAKQLPHPAYNSSQGQFYRDIIMNLYHCQNGLCAYTERTLVLTKPLLESRRALFNRFTISFWRIRAF